MALNITESGHFKTVSASLTGVLASSIQNASALLFQPAVAARHEANFITKFPPLAKGDSHPCRG